MWWTFSVADLHVREIAVQASAGLFVTSKKVANSGWRALERIMIVADETRIRGYLQSHECVGEVRARTAIVIELEGVLKGTRAVLPTAAGSAGGAHRSGLASAKSVPPDTGAACHDDLCTQPL